MTTHISLGIESMSAIRRGLSFLVLAAVAATPASATTFFVDSHAVPGGNGASWASAFKSLDDALLASAINAGPDEIWVAQGRYRPTVPTTGDLRSVTFKIPHNTTLRGGFLGTETSLPPLGTPRNTVLSGDVGFLGTATDNAYHVVTVESVNGTVTATIEGVMIREGYANAGDTRGGGLFVNGGTVGLNLYMSRCIVRDNFAANGGGMFFQSANVRMAKCTFEHNTAGSKGGALRAQAAHLRCDSSRFRSNTSIDAGGAVSITGNPSPDIVFMNCLFTSNVSTGGSGGAASMNSGQFTAGAGIWVNCTFADNAAMVSGGAVYAGPPTGIPAVAILRNCIAWNNFPAASTLVNAWDVTYSDIEGGWPGAGNINSNPFMTPTYGLAAGSPAIDAGNNNQVLLDTLDLDQDGNASEFVPLDLAGQARHVDDVNTIDTGAGAAPIVDMGAFELP